jgi:hypothetical protein
MDGHTRDLLKGHLEHMYRPSRFTEPPPPVVPAAQVAEAMVTSTDAVPPLMALARAAEAAALYIESRLSSDSSTGAHPRGAKNLRERIKGGVRLWVVKECANLIGIGQGPESITATEGGKLHLLAAAVWTYATGLDSDSSGSSQMTKDVKRVAPLIRTVFKKRRELDSVPFTDPRRAELSALEWETDKQLRRRQSTSKPIRQGSEA